MSVVPFLFFCPVPAVSNEHALYIEVLTEYNHYTTRNQQQGVDVGEPSLTNHHLAQKFLPSGIFRKPSFPKDASKVEFDKNFVLKVWLKIFEGFEVVSKKFQRFGKIL